MGRSLYTAQRALDVKYLYRSKNSRKIVESKYHIGLCHWRIGWYPLLA